VSFSLLATKDIMDESLNSKSNPTLVEVVNIIEASTRISTRHLL
jgi:hypothetical protein